MAPKMSKRPAAAMSSSPDANEDGCKRDKGKGEKWAKMADKKQIPDHLLALYNEVPFAKALEFFAWLAWFARYLDSSLRPTACTLAPLHWLGGQGFGFLKSAL